MASYVEDSLSCRPLLLLIALASCCRCCKHLLLPQTHVIPTRERSESAGTIRRSSPRCSNEDHINDVALRTRKNFRSISLRYLLRRARPDKHRRPPSPKLISSRRASAASQQGPYDTRLHDAATKLQQTFSSEVAPVLTTHTRNSQPEPPLCTLCPLWLNLWLNYCTLR